MLATAQGVPVKFVENTLVELRRAGIVTSQRGPEGGYRLARPADELAVADVIRVLEGPLARCGASARRTWCTTARPCTSSRCG